MLGDYKVYVNNRPTTRGWEEETEGVRGGWPLGRL